jgi:hypothetical protein
MARRVGGDEKAVKIAGDFCVSEQTVRQLSACEIERLRRQRMSSPAIARQLGMPNATVTKVLRQARPQSNRFRPSQSCVTSARARGAVAPRYQEARSHRLASAIASPGAAPADRSAPRDRLGVPACLHRLRRSAAPCTPPQQTSSTIDKCGRKGGPPFSRIISFFPDLAPRLFARRIRRGPMDRTTARLRLYEKIDRSFLAQVSFMVPFLFEHLGSRAFARMQVSSLSGLRPRTIAEIPRELSRAP